MYKIPVLTKKYTRIVYSVIATLLLILLNNISVSGQSILDVSTVLLEWSPDGTLLALATANGVEIYDENLDLIETLLDYSEQVVSVSWSPNSDYLAAVGYPFDFYEVPVPQITSSLLIWHSKADGTFTLQHQIDFPDDINIIALSWSPNGEMVATSEQIWLSEHFLGRIAVYETTNWSKISETSNSYEYLRTPVWNADSSIIAATGRGFCYELAGCQTDEADNEDILFLTDPLSGNRLDFEVIDAAVLSFDWSATNKIALPSGFLEVFDVTRGVRSAIEYDIDAFADKTIWRTDNELVIQAYPDEVLVLDTATEVVLFRQTIPNLWSIALHPNGSITTLTEDYQLLMLNPT